MSIVLLVANKNEIFLCGDKRITKIKQNIDGKMIDFTYNDQNRKIYKINDSLVIGAVGSRNMYEMFWDSAIHNGKINGENRRHGYKDFEKYFDKRLQEMFEAAEEARLSREMAEFECVIAGNDQGVVKSCVYAIADGKTHIKKHVFEESYGFVSLGIHGYDTVFLKEFENSNKQIEERVKSAFEQMIQVIQQKHNGVSLNYDVEHIVV